MSNYKRDILFFRFLFAFAHRNDKVDFFFAAVWFVYFQCIVALRYINFSFFRFGMLPVEDDDVADNAYQFAFCG